MKNKLLRMLQIAFEYYSGKAIDLEEKDKDPSKYFEICSRLESFIEEVETF